MTERSVTARAPAKVNLALSVGAVRPDGFHDLATVYQAVSLYDEVTVSRASGRRHRLVVDGLDAGLVPADESNLAVRAVESLATHHGVHEAVSVRIRKQIPVAGGLAGGSADAAAALIACAELWHTGTGQQDLLALAAGLGSDAPFSLLGGTAVGSGRGEAVSPALARGGFSWVLALAGRGLATPMVYAELDRARAAGALPRTGQPVVPTEVMAALRSGDPAALGPALCNDLEAAALRLRPRLRQLLDAGLEQGALGGVLAGSGPTCLFLTADADHALDLAARLAGTGLCRTALRAEGPVPGARLIG